MDPLATPTDVAKSLGLADATALSASMAARAPGELAKVSRRFRLESERLFTPGTYTHSLKIFAGMIRLQEIPDQVIGVTLEPGNPFGNVGITDADLVYEVVGNWVRFENWYRWRLSGRYAAVTYSWATPIPEDVVAAVASIAARNLTVDPLSALPQSTDLMDGRRFRQGIADWVHSGNVTGMTAEDLELARSYRYPAPPMIVAQMTSASWSPGRSMLSDSSW